MAPETYWLKTKIEETHWQIKEKKKIQNGPEGINPTAATFPFRSP